MQYNSHDKIIEKVRALLAKAESTEFEEEAAAFMAKAQELIARYSIENVSLTRESTGEKPTRLRIDVQNPYMNGKQSLLHYVAMANHCRCVSSSEGWSEVVGFASDIEMVDVLYTSLLFQATKSLTSQTNMTKARGARLRSFRTSFWYAYSWRIGARLEEATATVEAEHASLLPVLVRRDDQVEAALKEFFPYTGKREARSVSNLEGWAAGTAAADSANLAARLRLTGTDG